MGRRKTDLLLVYFHLEAPHIRRSARTEHLLGTLHCTVRDTVHYKPLRSVLLGAAYQKIELADAAKDCEGTRQHSLGQTGHRTQDNRDLMQRKD
jgi:hypothetical protein